jgi:hypothetical protein
MKSSRADSVIRPFHDPPDPVRVPEAPEARWIERLLWVFLLSFAFDYRARSGSEGGIDQMMFLAVCILSSAGIALLGLRFLTVRPGVWLLGFWGLFMAFVIVNSTLQGVVPGRMLRVALPLLLCLMAMTNAHVAGCAGIRPARIVRPILIAACVNILWRILYGFAFQGASVETVRFEVQSPANGWLAAWIGCALLLRPRFHWSLIAACVVLFTGIFITVTRSLFFPVAASAFAAGVCFLLGIAWRQHAWRDLPRRLLPVGVAVQPVMIGRWNERLFHNASDRNLSADISYLTRKAEADAMWRILTDEPVHFIHGRGVGSSYHWDSAYLPEIWQVLPKEDTEVDDVWFAGHSVWTYGLLSAGVIGITAYLGLLGGTMAAALAGARANSPCPGPDQWLAFLPLAATCCLISETLTTNPFQERLTGILFGMMAGLPQAFLLRASWIHTHAGNTADP